MSTASAPHQPFPALDGSVDPLAHSSSSHGTSTARRRRKSSGLGDMHAGDTGPGLATSLAHLSGAAHSGSMAKAGVKDKRFSKRRKARSFVRRVKVFAVKHTWVLPLVILLCCLSLYAVNPTESNPMHRFIFLSYKLPPAPGTDPATTPAQYGKGLWDVALVAFYTVVLSFTREFVMQELLRPLARYYGLRSRGKQARFMEQMYTALYFAILGPVGMYVMSRTPVWFFSTRGMYEGSPHHTHEALFKFYYLFQAAYWAQQAIVLVLGMEKPRKDFRELIGHHIVSLALIGLSYRFHFTYIGIAVYITHDISDFFLATSKSLNYIDSSLQGPYFGMFVLIWIYLRHYLNLRIIYSLFTEFQTIGPYELNWETGNFKCPLAFYITLALMSSLQALNLFWLFFILRIAYRFVVLRVAKDDRSEDEESELEDVDAAPAAPQLPNGVAATSAAVATGANGNAKANGSATKRR